MAFKNYNLKIRYAKKLRQNRLAPFWVVIKKFGRIVSIYRISRKRDWRYQKISF